MSRIARTIFRVGPLVFAASLLLGSHEVALALDFPGPAPGEAKGRIDGHRLVLENEVLECSWTVSDGRLKPELLTDKLSGTTLNLTKSECFQVVLAKSPRAESQTVMASHLSVVGEPVLDDVEPSASSPRAAERAGARRMTVDLASGDGNPATDYLPEASAEEIALFQAARAHLPSTVYDTAEWEAAAGTAALTDWWPRVVYLLNRGGRFSSTAYDNEKLKNKWGTFIGMYMEKVATTKNSMTGTRYGGLGRYYPLADARGLPIEDAGFDLVAITHRVVEHTKSRTIANKWLREVYPENFIQVSRLDAARLGLATGDRVRVESATNPTGTLDLGNGNTKSMAGLVRVSEGIRPGVIAYSLGHGHWAYGASDIEVDGERIAGDPERGRGVHLNPVLRTDPTLTNTCLSDLAGGSAVFYDTRVRLVKVAP